MKGIVLSPNHGLNPTICTCFWCGKEKNEIAFLGRIGNPRRGEDLKAPIHTVLDFDPCKECQKVMDCGFTVMEATTYPNEHCAKEMQRGVYPTGRYVVLHETVARRIFGNFEAGTTKAFLDAKVYNTIWPDGGAS